MRTIRKHFCIWWAFLQCVYYSNDYLKSFYGGWSLDWFSHSFVAAALFTFASFVAALFLSFDSNDTFEQDVALSLVNHLKNNSESNP